VIEITFLVRVRIWRQRYQPCEAVHERYRGYHTAHIELHHAIQFVRFRYQQVHRICFRVDVCPRDWQVCTRMPGLAENRDSSVRRDVVSGNVTACKHGEIQPAVLQQCWVAEPLLRLLRSWPLSPSRTASADRVITGNGVHGAHRAQPAPGKLPLSVEMQPWFGVREPRPPGNITMKYRRAADPGHRVGCIGVTTGRGHMFWVSPKSHSITLSCCLLYSCSGIYGTIRAFFCTLLAWGWYRPNPATAYFGVREGW
jgi:hypothetical protein